MDKRFVQAHKEARWAAVANPSLPCGLAGCRLSAGRRYWPNRPAALVRNACLLVPLVFILLCWAMVKVIYRDIPLEDDDAA